MRGLRIFPLCGLKNVSQQKTGLVSVLRSCCVYIKCGQRLRQHRRRLGIWVDSDVVISGL